MTYNPSAPDLLGLEWMPTRKGAHLLASIGSAVGLKLEADGTANVDSLWTYLEVIGAPILEVIVKAKTDLPETLTSHIYAPSADAAIDAGVSGSPNNTVGQRYQNVDEAALVATPGDYIDLGNGDFALFRAAAGGFAGRPLGVRVYAYAYLDNASSTQVAPLLRIGADDFTKPAATIALDEGAVLISGVWDTNPATGLPWTAAEIQAFATTSAFGVAQPLAGSGGDNAKILQTWLQVPATTAPLGIKRVAPTADGWVEVAFDATIPKVDGTEYVAVIRKINSDGEIRVVNLDSGFACPHAGHASYRPSIDENGLIEDLGAELTAVSPLVLEASATATPDSQPYADLVRQAVYTGRTIEQEITGGAASRGYFAILAALQGKTADGDLLVELVKRGTGAVIASGTVSADDLYDAPRTLHVIGATFAAVAAQDATQHALRFSSTATAGTGWEIPGLDTKGAPLGNTTGFGGTTDVATIAGLESSDIDIPAVVGTVPDAPADLNLAVVS